MADLLKLIYFADQMSWLVLRVQVYPLDRLDKFTCMFQSIFIWLATIYLFSIYIKYFNLLVPLIWFCFLNYIITSGDEINNVSFHFLYVCFTLWHVALYFECPIWVEECSHYKIVNWAIITSLSIYFPFLINETPPYL